MCVVIQVQDIVDRAHPHEAGNAHTGSAAATATPTPAVTINIDAGGDDASKVNQVYSL